uniref:Transcription initiation factor TFIID subunit 4-like n=1 Tax=Sphaeramia orbicularis TaxID=375764 RepID=A0A673A9T5_9TELE
MAVGSGPMDELFLHTEVNKAVVYHPLRSVESQLLFLCHYNHWFRHESAGYYIVIVPGQGVARANVQLGLAPELTENTGGVLPHHVQYSFGGVTSLPNHQGKVGSFSVQTLNAAGGGGLTAARMPPSSNSVIQTSLMNSQSVAVSQTAGPTVTLVRPPMQPAGSGTTLNGNNNPSPAASATTTGQTCVGIQTPLVNNSQPVSVSAGSHIIKQEPPTTIIQSAPQQAVAPGAVSAPRTPATVAAVPGGIRALTPQMLAPRLPQTSPGQPSVHNIQLPPGMVLVRSESGQLLMIPQQALAQMQSQAQAQAQGGLAPRPATPTNLTPGQETMENVKKCKNFLSTLIKLASTGKQSTETAASVRELVKDLLEGKLEAEEFTSRLYKELNSSPQPYLVPFLKRSLPALRQLTPDSAAFIQQSQLSQSASGPVSSASSTPTTVILGSPAPRLTAPITRPQLQPGVSKPGQTSSLVLQSQQQRAMLRPQVTLPTASMVTLRNQTPGRIMMGQQQVQLKELQPGENVQEYWVCVHYCFYIYRDDDDINDVASMAGVNLSEESANILATNSGLVGAVTHSCEDEAFLSCALLQRKMLDIGRRFGVTDLGAEVVTFVSHAAQQRLQNLLQKVSQVAQQKNTSYKEDDNYEQCSDVRAQLKFFEQLDQLEKQRKEEQEREILLKAAKSRARQEDPEQLRLKQKAKEMQQQELAQMRQREANLTALAAIGPRKKRKIPDSSSSSTAAEGSGSGPSLSAGAASSSSRHTRQRITRVNLRDLLFCLENERFTSRSHFLYKGFLK